MGQKISFLRQFEPKEITKSVKLKIKAPKLIDEDKLLKASKKSFKKINKLFGK
jgi:hypothetical protein